MLLIKYSCSRYTFVCFLRRKKEAHQQYSKLLADVSPVEVIATKSFGGREFCGGAFHDGRQPTVNVGAESGIAIVESAELVAELEEPSLFPGEDVPQRDPFWAAQASRACHYCTARQQQLTANPSNVFPWEV